MARFDRSDQQEKRNNGDGGMWRIPPCVDGNKRVIVAIYYSES